MVAVIQYVAEIDNVINKGFCRAIKIVEEN